ncbi:NAD(P)-dependent alcohol dehydrogenase [Leeia aquatica]|uniref:NAD(P)-dependent alcohol dehydrogenase n=1 Tax=Leeia aquatica TaxID=2725557 RepID=A0A847RSF5_9NEIS|nr:NAD(P)-dependent alcohol dehydrogenase [Leeia aquatica]NLR74140.1 NAD(P)-dependent alcohol dehydrogenase [Leeia aquatica]
MKVYVCERYGAPEVLTLQERPQPVPQDKEVLIKVHATTVNSGDCRVRALNVPLGFRLISRLALGFSKPRQPVLGTELAGEVVAVGQAVQQFVVGDRVFAFTGMAMGCHAEYRCLPEDGKLARIPAGLSDAEAAALCFGGMTALDYLRRGRLQPGERILINGASGTVGSALVQLARHQGAEVTAVCSTANVERMYALGAAQAIDYTREDFTQRGERWDVIVDTVGNAPYRRSKSVLNAGGRLLLVLAGLPDMLPAPWVALTTRHRIIAGPAAERREDLLAVAELAASGVFKPVIDCSYPFERMVEAHRYVDGGHKRGSVVIELLPD